MPRWEPNAQQRLELAALDLYATRGYHSTTVGDIASHAGVTSRTYFRYFPDKREILFGGAEKLRNRITRALRDTPANLSPLDATLQAMSSCDDLFQLREHEHLRQREVIIRSADELQEREARKLASIAADVAGELVERGSGQDDAQLVADLALVVFKQASRLWMDDPTTSYAILLQRAAAQARTLLTAEQPTSGRNSSVVAADPPAR
jgi:AcrR family transcriptional regulator